MPLAGSGYLRATRLISVSLPACSPIDSFQSDQSLLPAATGDTAVLRVAAFADPAIAAGRFSLFPDQSSRACRWFRRNSGGRAVPIGPGFLSLSLYLEHRSALVSDAAFALRPEQVPNRCVRGILSALRRLNLDATFNGRDWILSRGRILGWVSFHEAADDHTIVEASIANDDTFASLPFLIDELDPSGLLSCEIIDTQQATSLSAELGTPLALDSAVDLICAGYAAEFGLSPERPQEYRPAPLSVESEKQFDEWQFQRVTSARRSHRASRRFQLGLVSVELALDATHRIDDVVLSGDFIASSRTIDGLEKNLHGIIASEENVRAVVEDSFNGAGCFILGMGRLDGLVALIMEAATR